MSGHSKWAKIKRQKGATDAKRGAIFTKISRDITVAAQEGGGDPDMNFTLRLAVEKAKQANMPKTNIEQAIKRGIGEAQGDVIRKNTYEAITNFGVGILIDTTTDNSNRTFSEVKNIIEKNGEKISAAGAVSWQFQQQGRIKVAVAQLKKSDKYGVADTYNPDSLEKLEEALFEIAGVVDFESISRDEFLNDYSDSDEDQKLTARDFVLVRTEVSALKSVTEELYKLGWQVLASEIIWYPQSVQNISEEKQEKLASLLEEISDHDDVDNVWTNANGF